MGVCTVWRSLHIFAWETSIKGGGDIHLIVSSTAVPIATGSNDICRMELSPTEKPRLSRHNAKPGLDEQPRIPRQVIVPGQDLQVRGLLPAQGLDDGAGKLQIGYQRDAGVDRLASNQVAVGSAHLVVPSRHVDDQIHPALVDEIEGAVLAGCILADLGARESQIGEHLRGSLGGVEG